MDLNMDAPGNETHRGRNVFCRELENAESRLDSVGLVKPGIDDLAEHLAGGIRVPIATGANTLYVVQNESNFKGIAF